VALHPALAVFGSAKDFDGRWIGSPTLNRLGLHVARMAVTDGCLWLRRRQLAPRGADHDLAGLLRDGVAVVPDFLPPALFIRTRDEALAKLRAAAAAHPEPEATGVGFGAKQPFAGGFDRFDGGTLNRYLAVTPTETPACAEVAQLPRLVRAYTVASGFRPRPDRFWIYLTRHGDERRFPDLQKVLHRDTFHSTVKLWLFLDDCAPEEGPFMYVPGSHRMTPARRRWEHERARAGGGADRDGSFRVTGDELAAMGLPPARPYPVAANTLVIADVRGFHRRGDARPGARRLSLYANLRRWPFAPVAY
jgi:hypothetical protein